MGRPKYYWPAARSPRLVAQAGAIVALVIVSVGLTGCGGDSAGATGGGAVLVSGRVSVGGKPVDNGQVEFIPKPGFVAPVVAVAIEKGTYRVTAEHEALAGPYVVTIRGTSKTGGKKEHPDYLNCFIPVTKKVVALKYMSNADTPLSAELSPGTRVLDFLLPPLTAEEQAEIDAEEEKERKEAEEKAQGGSDPR